MSGHDAGQLEAVGRLVHDARRRSLERAVRGGEKEGDVEADGFGMISEPSSGLPFLTVVRLKPWLKGWDELDEAERGLCLEVAGSILDGLSDLGVDL